MIILLLGISVIPIVAMIIALLSKQDRIAEFVNLLSSILTFIFVCPLPWIARQGPYYFLNHFVVVDALGAWVMFCVGIVYLLASLYAIGYMRGTQQENNLHRFYALFALFAWVMFMAPLMNDIAVYWIAIEMSTLVSTFLVGFVQAPQSIEAAWKYIVIVSAGIAFALLGVILFYWGGTFILGAHYHLTWDVLKTIAPKINTVLLLPAFLLVLVGFGTKVGLAPMHTWLPDAHSEGPAPVSAMLSGALLNVAMLGIVRFLFIVNQTAIKNIADTILILLGIFSLTIAALFIINQKDMKRLMAYSSVEHMGVLALGFGFGGTFGIAGALYHMIGHSLNKSLMFFGAGNMMHMFHTKIMDNVSGILKKFPFSGMLWLMGAIAITGSPPFSLFLSEITVLRAGLSTINSWAVFMMALLLIVIFCGFLNHFRKMYFEQPNCSVQQVHPKISAWCIVPMILAIIPLLFLGLYWPHVLWNYFAVVNLQLH